MNIYRVTRTEPWITNAFTGMIVIAENEEKARQIYPENHIVWDTINQCWMHR